MSEINIDEFVRNVLSALPHMDMNGKFHRKIMVKALRCIKQLQSQLDTARKGNYSGCVHTTGTAVDREGCCTSCGEDLNYLAMMQIKLDSANHDYDELVKERADYVAENKRLRPALSNLIGYHYHNDIGVKPKVYHKAVQALKKGNP